ncbi:hypothetical protein DVH24_010443 [Malus domestica]|uniref:Reverse transcriptase zinc-binding domain-containing protein n=1 Tax=Malus domestica TaxID=3750 RepID=A0A498JQR6_MALDO|nr:hypothetical protein DVH24_010443 [Malus domestica]
MDRLDTVSKLISQEEGVSWNLDIINELFWEEEALLIQSIPLGTRKPLDQLVWNTEPNGKFTTKSAYYLSRFMGEWRARVPEKVKICVWRICWNALPTHDNLRKKKITMDDVYMFCNGENETLVHLIRNCPRAASVWLSCPLRLQSLTNTTENIMDWIAKLAGELSRDSTLNPKPSNK